MASLQRKQMKRVLPLISKGTWFDSRSSSWPSQQKSKGWNTKSRSFYGNSGLYSECTQVQHFTGNFQRFSEMIEIKSTVSQPVWPLCLRLKIMRISFEQCWSQQVHRAFEVKCSLHERQSLMSQELQQGCIYAEKNLWCRSTKCQAQLKGFGACVCRWVERCDFFLLCLVFGFLFY